MRDHLTFYGLDLSYFTGKVEAFLRYREIAHRRVELSTRDFRAVAQATGRAQMPALEWPDGRWMTDSTAMITWLDDHTPGHRVIPATPYARFFSLLLEDYADEWLWRPALHYRWSYEPDRTLMSYRIATEMMHDVPLPLFIRKRLILERQIRKYVRGDGIKAQNRAHVESIYLRNLGYLSTMLESRPYLMGSHPSIADFGFFASMFRHFGLDPTPARIMRDQAPAVYEWVARLWHARSSKMGIPVPTDDRIPDDWDLVLTDIGQCYLPYLIGNAKAFGAGRSFFDLTIEGVAYHLPVHPYRVYCLEQLLGHFKALTPDIKVRVIEKLQATNAFHPVWTSDIIPSGWDDRGRQPV